MQTNYAYLQIVNCPRLVANKYRYIPIEKRNYEMNRELLWREYPTDQRGTPLRHFWGTKNVGATTFIDSDEKNMDIKPIHSWKTITDGVIYPKNLGDNTNRTTSGMVVLAIRGELLKKYPNTNIYMQKATWNALDGNGDITSILLAPGKPRNLAPTSTTTIKKPLFFSQINPDLYFVGFEISASAAKGNSTPNATNPGWFVCFEERAGEIVFGADEEREAGKLFQTWDDLIWADLGNPLFINTNQIGIVPIGNDDGIVFGSNSADMGYVLFQKPSRVFIHSNDMLI